MRTTIDLPEALLENSKRRAKELHVTLSDVVQDGLRMVLSVPSGGPAKGFVLVTAGEGGSADPELRPNRIAHLFEEEDLARYAANLGK